ncbi:UPF0496 protein At1g20180-like [Gastrolobium bilobum]|uniref:UPF0496 protein At1g20180-like n=1 Tax=Gastrolobium bilobum TaxID=150636 RepID=UPI002AB2F6FB|nr:UPF0496 protein At1g20180-like [Gastrolobium bilobum]
MTNNGWLSRLRGRTGRSRKEYNEDSFSGKPNVNREYLKAFRTKSYVEICNKAQGQLGETSTRGGLFSFSSSPSSPPSFMNLTEYLLEPRQEIITNITKSFKVHHLLVDYFEASLEACRCCDKILEGIHKTRLAYGRVTKIVKLSKRVIGGGTDIIGDDQSPKVIIYRELASFVLQNNPLSRISPVKFRDIHDRHMLLLNRLKTKREKIRRGLTIKRVLKKVGGIGLVISHSALLVALLVLALHSIIGLVAAPCIVGSVFCLFKKGFRWVHKRFRTSSSKRLYEQLDVAAKGVYILINDLDTMSRMVNRLHEEVEHRREVADICVKSENGEILKEVVREFHDYESNFLDQLEELEEHIYLCFLTINRSRRLVLQEITDKQQR